MKNYLLLKLLISLFLQVNCAYAQDQEIGSRANVRSKIINSVPLFACNGNFEERETIHALIKNYQASKEEIEDILVSAAERGYEAVVESILLTPRLDIKKYWAFFQAIRHHKLKIVEIFLNSVSFDQEIIDSAFRIAVTRGNLDIIETCLHHPQQRPTQNAIDGAYESINTSDFSYWNNPKSKCVKQKLLLNYISSLKPNNKASQFIMMYVPCQHQNLSTNDQQQVTLIPVAFPIVFGNFNRTFQSQYPYNSF